MTDDAGVSPVAEERTTPYIIDARISRFTVRATAGGLFSALGHNPTFAVRDISGVVNFDPDAPETGSLELSVRADSLQLQDDVSEKDRREIVRATRDDVLEVERYPEIRFESEEVRVRESPGGPMQIVLRGSLTLHGVTRPQSIPVRLVQTGSMLRANGEFTLRQTDFGIRLVNVGGRMLQVKDELACAFDIVSRRRE